jgi:hypothetical protein
MVLSLPLFKSGTCEGLAKSSADFCAFLGLGVFRIERHKNGPAKMTKRFSVHPEKGPGGVTHRMSQAGRDHHPTHPRAWSSAPRARRGPIEGKTNRLSVYLDQARITENLRAILDPHLVKEQRDEH